MEKDMVSAAGLCLLHLKQFFFLYLTMYDCGYFISKNNTSSMYIKFLTTAVSSIVSLSYSLLSLLYFWIHYWFLIW